MLRRLALLVALLSPVAALAQTTPAAGAVTVVPGVFGRAACGLTDAVTLTWTSSQAIVASDIYRIVVATTACTSGTPTQLGGDLTATNATQSLVTNKTDLLTAAGLAACPTTGNSTIYVCVQHWQSGATTAKATSTGTATYEGLLPPVPVSVAVAPGDSALFVGWADGASTGVTAAKYRVTAVAQSNTLDTQSDTFTGKSDNRIGGLTNGRTYDVTVTSISAGGNESAPSSAVPGTPQVVNGFWEQYKKDSGVEQGGCGGGPAGVVALLGVALALRGLRRRS